MATLIQSKQIQGVVTASVIEGDFSVSGSLVVTGSQTILGSVTASSISSSFIGDGSGLTGISYSQVLSTPQFVSGNNITITSSSNVITIDASLNGAVSSSTQITDGSGILSSSNETFPQFSSSADVRLINLETYSSSLDSRFLNTGGDNVVSASSQITISDTIGYTAFSSSLDLRIDVEKSRVDAILDSVDADKDSFAEIVTLINQVDTTNDVAFAAHYTSSRQRDTSLELFSSSIQSEVDSLTSVTSSYLTEIPQGTISGSEQLPSGLVSSSNQVLGGTGILSGSYTDITDLNTFTQSVDTRVTSLESFSSSLDNTFATDAELTSLSSSVSSNKSDINSLGNANNVQNTRLGNLELFTASLDSTYATDSELSLLSSSIDSKIESLSHSDNTELNTFTSSIQSEVDALIAATASYLTSETDSQTLTVSGDQLTISSGNTVTIPTGSNTDITELNTFTSSIQSEVDVLSAQTSSYLTELPSGLVSGSVVEELPSGVISGSTQITITESQISDLTHYTNSDVQSYLDSKGIFSGSVVEELPSGTISGSSQVTIGDTDGFTSFSSSIDNSISTEKARIDAILLSSDADKDSFAEIVTLINQVDTTNDNAFAAHYTASNARIDSLEGFTSSIDTTIKTKLDTEGIVSGSTQVLGGSGIVSSSTQIESLLPVGTISGSSQVITHLPIGSVSGSTQVLGGSNVLSSSVTFESFSSSFDGRVTELETTFSSSVSDNLIILNDLSSSHVVESQSLDRRLDGLEGGAALYYDLSNTVWNNKFIKSGSNEASDTDGFQTGNVPFTFTLNQDNRLSYEDKDVVFITNFDRDTVIHALVTGSYNEITREVRFNVLDVNGITGSVKINDPYWIITKQSSGFVQLNDYRLDSSSFDSRLIESFVSSSDQELRLLESFSTASNHEGRINVVETTYVTTQSLNAVSNSIDTRIDNVYLSQSIALSGVVSGSSQIDFREVSNYVADEHIDHTTILINAGDGLDGGGDISSTRELRLNVTSSHFTSGVGNVLTSEGVVKQSTLDADIIGTDYSQSVDTRIRSFAASSVPNGTVSGSTQIDITQTENYTAFSSSIATSISNVDGGAATDISHLNTFSSSIQSTVDSLVDVTASYATTGSNTFIGDQSILGSLIPGAGGIHNLGSADNPYGELFLTTGSVYLGNNKLSIDSDNDFKIESDGSLANLIANYIHFGNDKKKLSLNSDNKLQFTDNSNSVNYGFDLGANSLSDLIDVSSTSPTDGQSLVWDADNSTWIPSTVVAGSEIPQGTISSSQQISDLGFVTSSGAEGEHTDITLLNTFSGSIQSQVDTLIASTASYLTSETDNQTLTIVGDQLTISDGNTITIPTGSNVTLPSGLVSSSEQILGGSGILSGSHTDISHLNQFTSSVQTEIDGLSSVTSSYLTELPSGLVSGSSQLTSSLDTRYALSGSGGVGGDVTFDGNRVISNEDLGDLFSNSVNPGTDGTIQDFLNAVFYPNSAPSITTGNQTIQEYTTNGSTIVTLAGTDPEGQTLTWGTADSYTDGLVSVASNGVMTLSSLPTSASFNTSAVGGGFGHLVTVKVTDTFNTTTEKDIYIIVTPNEAPKFRETSVAGTIINSVNVNLNENSVNNTLVKRIFFTDTESDTITITTSSIDNEHFDVDIQSTYVDIRQNTGSLDYEQKTSYTFNIFAADEHYQAGDDLDSITTLPITINVVDNLVPTINDQTLSSINENSSNGAPVDSISAADNEGDTITFSNFTLSRLELDGVEVTQGTYGGTSQLTDPHENPFQMDSSGNVTRKSGVFLNSDLINEYQYTVVVKDGFNSSSSPATITIPITDDTPATLTDNWSAGPYIIESAVTGNTIKTSSNGRTGTQADYNSNQSGTWTSSNSVVSINSNGNLSLGSDVRGNYVSGNTITSTITFTNAFGTTTTDTLNLSVAANSAPTATFSNTSFNNTNQATGSANMVSVTISDTEGDTPYGLTLSGTNASSLNAVPQNADSSSWELQVASDLSAGTYTYDVTVTDNFGKSTSYNGRTLTINQASNGTMVENGTFYVIESAQSGPIYINSSGRSGSSGVTTVSYSTNYGSQVAKDFTSSNSLIGINSVTGVLSVGSPISGSGNTNGSVITSTITWVDQYGNNGSDTIAVNVTKNNAPTVSSTQTFNTNTNQATGSSEIVRLNLTDTEGDSILASGLSWSGYDSTYFTPSNSTGVMRLLVNSTSIPAGVYGYTASIEDVHGFDTTLHSSSVTIAQSDNGTLGGDTSIYIIESALQNSVFRDASGYNNGSAAQLSVSYSPSHGSPSVQTYSSSNPAITVDGSGNLTLGVDISGSVTQSGDTINSDITFTDQYGNVGSGSVTATVFGNSAPSATFTANSLNSDEAIDGADIGSVTVTDTEGNSPFTLTIGGTDGSKFRVSGVSSPFEIQPTETLSAGNYSINITVTDNYGESVTLNNETITVTAAEVLTTGYIYYSAFGSDAGFSSNYLGLMGASTVNSDVPPEVTAYTANTLSPFNKFKTGDIGSTSITYAGGTTATLGGTISGSNFNDAIKSAGNMSWGTGVQTIFVIPSGSTMTGIPTSMTDATGGSTSGEYVLVEYADGTSAPLGATPSIIHSIVLDSPKDGYTEWFVLGAKQQNSASNMRLQVIPSSGSIGDFV